MSDLRLGAAKTGEQQPMAASAVAKQICGPVVVPKSLKLALRQRDPLGFSRGGVLIGRRTPVDLVQAEHWPAPPASDPSVRPPALVLFDPGDHMKRAGLAGATTVEGRSQARFKGTLQRLLETGIPISCDDLIDETLPDEVRDVPVGRPRCQLCEAFNLQHVADGARITEPRADFGEFAQRHVVVVAAVDERVFVRRAVQIRNGEKPPCPRRGVLGFLAPSPEPARQ